MPYKRVREKGKYWYYAIGRHNAKKLVYRRRFMHSDGVSRAIDSESHKDWSLKVVQHFIDAKANPYPVEKNTKKATYAELFSEYLEVVESKRAVGTYVTIKGLFERHILPHFKDHVVSKTITPELAEFAETLTKESGALVTKEVFKVFNTFLNWCQKKKKCFKVNPIDNDLRETIRENRNDALKIKQKQESEFPLATKDVLRIYDDIRGDNSEIIYNFLAHAIRLGECLGVRVKDISLPNGTLTLSHQVQSYSMRMLEGTRYLSEDGFGENSSAVVLDHLKTEESHGKIQLLPETVELIIKRIADLNLKPEDLIYQTKNGTPCTPNNFRTRHWKPRLKKLGLDHKVKLTPHVMRGYVFSKGVASGGDSAAISKALRHKNISTTLLSYFPDIEDDNQVNPLGHMSQVINK